MTTKVTYHAIVSEFSSRDEPGGVLRRIGDDEGQHDEAFTRDLTWKPSASLYAAERGDTMNGFYEISEAEAMAIVGRIRRDAGKC